ncbi:unnamed protein product [Protopolystoma xenopodis]|uniref:Serine/threonine-protein kinase mTOR domain-containing protein n=1 Tax=Protopolystoma xenopodis TaxID=117903 RepID=A0A448X2H8_9PLAT|nr:unnamed protein product [Protopolystoma xenopodis]
MLVTNTGYAVEPYKSCPHLLYTLFNMLRREESRQIRREVIRAFGLVGALDPLKLKINLNLIDSIGDTGIAISLYERPERKEG